MIYPLGHYTVVWIQDEMRNCKDLIIKKYNLIRIFSVAEKFIGTCKRFQTFRAASENIFTFYYYKLIDCTKIKTK